MGIISFLESIFFLFRIVI
ncbi:hypothetical protein LINPERPRIM_LOCUS25507 [Linum perenne]